MHRTFTSRRAPPQNGHYFHIDFYGAAARRLARARGRARAPTRIYRRRVRCFKTIFSVAEESMKLYFHPVAIFFACRVRRVRPRVDVLTSRQVSFHRRANIAACHGNAKRKMGKGYPVPLSSTRLTRSEEDLIHLLSVTNDRKAARIAFEEEDAGRSVTAPS